ncbi:MAG: DEAD/DEAH box helicase [Ilumatobacteraceae bacterium]
MASLRDLLPAPGADPMEVVDAFGRWAAEGGRPLYPHQEEAILALAMGEHVVLATPTGSGKSLVAMAGVALALNAGTRAVWTAPIKALVAEKFFDLVDLLGAEHVGLATGDASINSDAPVLVCTAEVLANHALATGSGSEYGFACLDEFHYYGERDRGWAWQVPLLELTNCQMLLASATLGDMTAITTDLEQRSGRSVASVTSVDRPTPLYHQWRTTHVADSVLDAVRDGITPVYVVHATQANAIERAQSLVSLAVTTRPQRDAIVEALKGERPTRGFGEVLDRLLRNGVGVHHAGMLPRHRRLVERLAGAGLLPVICGTDTLGVGVNIPIRTVLMTALTKFDGSKVRTFSVREFRQLSGRAGRPGFDPDGHVWVQAPEHVIDNAKALSKAGDDPKARRKAVKAKPPEGFVHYDEATMQRLVTGEPEALVSRFRVTADMVANVLGRPDGPDALKRLLATNHDPALRRRQHKRRAIEIYRSLEAAGVAERLRDADGRCAGVRVGSLVEGSDERAALRFSAPLMPFAIEVVATFDRDDPDYVLDVVSVVESVLDDPRQILYAQQNAAKGAEVARLKAEGVPYEERIERVEAITWPMPLRELLDTCIEQYRSRHPWVAEGPSPKSILREMLEHGDTFASFVRRYRLDRSEGLVLRYLTDAWRTLDRSLPDDVYVDTLEDVVEWLGTLIRATDATLLDEWAALAGRPVHDHLAPEALVELATGPPAAWRTAVRTAIFRWVELLARRDHATLAERSGWDAARLHDAMAPYWDEHDHIGIDGDARAAVHLRITESPGRWTVEQTLVDPQETGEWRIVATVDLEAARLDGSPTLRLEHLGPDLSHRT